MAPTTAPAKRKRGEGQWALGHLEPLNPNERFKKDDDGLNVRARIENVYSQRGFASIDPADLRGRFRWWGLYTQRRPGIPGGRTAVLEPHELDDEFFMLRIRIDGGQLTTEQLRVIADVSTSYARDTADVTDRQNVQLHWIRVEDVPEIWQRLEAVGLSTTEACGDTPRVVLGSPVAGIAADEVSTPPGRSRKSSAATSAPPEFSNLPRKFKTAVSGLPDVVHEVERRRVRRRRPPRARSRPRPVGRRWAVHQPEARPAARRLGADRRGARRLGRRRRHLPRLRLPATAHQGPAEVPRRRLGRRAVPRGARDRVPAPTAARRAAAPDPGPAVRPHRRAPAEGRPVLRRGGATGGPGVRHCLRKLADTAEAHGSTRLRTTPYQKLVILDVEPDQVEPLVGIWTLWACSARPSAFRRTQWRAPASSSASSRSSRPRGSQPRRSPSWRPGWPTSPTSSTPPITLNVNGCPNSCARIQVADIGLKGQIVKDQDGFQVHLGGGVGLDAGFGRKLRGLKVTAAELPDYVERVVRRSRRRTPGERFAQWVARAAEEDLQ